MKIQCKYTGIASSLGVKHPHTTARADLFIASRRDSGRENQIGAVALKGIITTQSPFIQAASLREARAGLLREYGAQSGGTCSFDIAAGVGSTAATGGPRECIAEVGASA